MSKRIGPACKQCRREGDKLFLKGERCLSNKCAFDRRGFAPGQHGKEAQFKRQRLSDYARQLREKQKARRVYGVLEAQFRRYYAEALKKRGMTGLNLLQLLESRLDNMVYRMGFAESRAKARSLVTHGHFNVNGRRTDVPSYVLRPGDKIEVRAVSRTRTYFKGLAESAESRAVPTWINRDLGSLSGGMAKLPERHELSDIRLNEQLIVEFYSR
ncbi:MAG: 30S ribosomal protein S4 [Anaerolineales bacterium]|nr:30S ribosomal protein S4 [Anaerolineales bacterium]